MGVGIDRGGGGAWAVDGVGTGCLLQPDRALDMGNSGTSARLLMGLVASHPITAAFTGDASLSPPADGPGDRPAARGSAPMSRPAPAAGCR